MYLISDKLENNDSKYDLMKDQKDDVKNENIDFGTSTPSRMEKCHKSHFIYALLIGVVFFFAIWTMITPKYYEAGPNVDDVENEIVQLSYNMVNDTQFILNHVRAKETDIIEENERYVGDYITNIRDILKNRSDKIVQKVNEILTDKVRELENDLTGFDGIIKEAADSIVDAAKSDIDKLRPKIADIKSGDVAKSIDGMLKAVQTEMESMWYDLDQMYNFYAFYIYDNIQTERQKTVDRLSRFLTARRKKCDNTVLDKINMCFSIETQNIVIGSQVKDVMKAFEIAGNFTNTVIGLEPVFENSDEHHRHVFEGVKLTTNKVIQDNQQTLESLLKSDSCFLGTAVRKAAFVDHINVKDYILRTFKTTFDSSVDEVKRILNEFVLVRENLWNQLRVNVHSILTKIGDDLKSKATLINGTSVRDEYIKKADFEGLKSWMDNKFRNVTSVINPLFEERKGYIIDTVEINSQWLQSQYVPFVSTLSVQNYLPTDVCPMSIDYQNYLSGSLEATISKMKNTDDVIEDATYFSTDNFSIDFAVPVDMLDESAQNANSKELSEKYDKEIQTSPADLKNVDIKKMIPEKMVEAIIEGDDFSDETEEEELMQDPLISLDFVDITIILPESTEKENDSENIQSIMPMMAENTTVSNMTQDNNDNDETSTQMLWNFVNDFMNTFNRSPNDNDNQLETKVDDTGKKLFD